MRIALIVLSKMKRGGTTTYTAHLCKTLMSVGHDVDIVKITQRRNTEPEEYYEGTSFIRHTLQTLDYADYDAHIVTVVEKEYIDVLTVLCRTINTAIVFHDPKILRHIPDWHEWGRRIITIRPSGLHYMPRATYIPHPYVRAEHIEVERNVYARSISRIDFDKHTDTLLDANRILPYSCHIDILGAENRMYVHHKLSSYPEYKSHPFTSSVAVLMAETKFMVDMSTIVGDGGGTQYTFLEAMDQGAVCVLNGGWLKPGGEMVQGVNCIGVDRRPNGENLAHVLLRLDYEECEDIRAGAESVIAYHDPSVVGPMYDSFIKEVLQ